VKIIVTAEFKDLQKALDQLSRKLPESANTAAVNLIATTTYAVHAAAIDGIKKISAGKRAIRYFPGGGKRTVTVSRPGDTFNIDTGETTASIQPKVDRNALEGKIVGDMVAYWLEVGTSRMAARPWLSPAVRSVSGRLASLFKFTLEE
jgi:hypothetical protein